MFAGSIKAYGVSRGMYALVIWQAILEPPQTLEQQLLCAALSVI